MSAASPFAVVVDDDPIILMSACAIVEDAGFTALDATTVAEAIAHFEGQGRSIVLLFTDVQMPGGRNGFELAREVAARWPETTILVASGNCKPELGELPEGAVFLGKPFSAALVYDSMLALLPDGQTPAALREIRATELRRTGNPDLA
ncbi:response regulator [Sphingomonas sp.]|uniref:response regulator n=1 Tax=Sphingomonas sp. TaxID=28214 RepID=UPI0025D5C7CE|nr:response regulator [Sphingomonas sp.]MBV9529045.1 response regulator [Sphingomonas sp.]MBV9841387.1 response regulator [Sphingomonadaceae bacterium]